MDNVKLDNYGSGFRWHGTSRGKRYAFDSARAVAIAVYGPEKVLRAETVSQIRDTYVRAYAADQLGVTKLLGPGTAQEWSLLSTPEIREDRWRKYCAAVAKLDIVRYPNLPPNYELVIQAARGDADASKRLGKFGQRGLGPEVSEQMTNVA